MVGECYRLLPEARWEAQFVLDSLVDLVGSVDNCNDRRDHCQELGSSRQRQTC